MSSTKKDPSFCVAANDPHLVSLGGGRLSTAVTIHNIPIGDTTVGSSTRCSISLNGSGVLALHCTIYRSEENEVTLVPERDARILIDGSKIVEETNLTQGTMITIGKSYYMRFNNPAEAHQIRTAMGSYERVSMPQIDFSSTTQRNSIKSSKGKSGDTAVYEIDSFYESTIRPNVQTTINNSTKASCTYANLTPIDINGLHCPKVFTADLVTVNMPAEDVLGQRYTRFAKHSSENQRNEKNINNAKQNNNETFNEKIYDNVPVLQHQNAIKATNTSKSKNVTDSHRQAASAYDRYPKLGNMQIFPMNSVNNEINTKCTQLTVYNCLDQDDGGEANGNITNDEKHHLDDMLKICTEYTDRQNQNTVNSGSSPIVQNRIKTNGSLPRERKSPFPQEMQRSFDGSFSNLTTTNCEIEGSECSNGYENVRVIAPKRVEINNQQMGSPKDNYDNVIVGKYIPQSPRTKIRTNCMSPKRDQSFSSMFSQNTEAQQMNNANAKKIEYDELLKTFGEKLEIEMAAIEESSRYQSPSSKANSSNMPSNLNKNNLKLNLNLKLPSSLQNSPKLNKKPAPAPRTLIKNSGGSLPQLSGTFTSGCLYTNKDDLQKRAQIQSDLQILQEKIHRLEAQRNATRVMEENQQAKLKQSIEMKLDQVKKLKAMLKEKKDNECLKDELKFIGDSLDSDRKVFEDLEFQYLEEESEWHAYHEELKAEERQMTAGLAKQQSKWELHISDVKQTDVVAPTARRAAAAASADVEKPYDIREAIGIMSQSLFGSAEMLCPKRQTGDVMSRSVNENMFFNNKIELPSNGTAATSTPKRPQLQVVTISDEYLNGYSTLQSANDGLQFNLTLGNDDFEVNPLEKRVPSQDDIDRISKVTSDAPISSTQGASTKIFDSIKEIERNRQLLLAQQGHHVIEHERQKMNDLKKKSHSEARAEYISMLSRGTTTCVTNHNAESQKQWPQEHPQVDKENHPTAERKNEGVELISQQRHSQPELESSHYQHQQHLDQNKRHSCSSRPLSEANSELSCDLPPVLPYIKPSIELTALNNIANATNIDDQRSSSSNSNDVSTSHQTREHEANERKRMLPKHQRPLTRYLPIFSPDLDLRQHIETAGHQIALCPHVFVDTHSCRGYLHKLGATFHGWSKRWFVLDRQRNALIYYSDKLERKPRGGAYFSTIDEVYLDHLNVSKSGRPHCTFIVKTKKRSYQLQAASDAAARIWIDAIITGAQGNLDY